MIPKMKRFIELNIPTKACNLRCSYCYLAQSNTPMTGQTSFRYSPEHIRKALSKERMGGVCYINFCAVGETLIPAETFEIARELLEEGHYVNIITNGTLKNRIRRYGELDAEHRARLSFMFSLHYFELLKHDLLDVFFENYNYLRSMGFGCILSMNLTDQYMNRLDEIKSVCIEKTGYFPQLAPTRQQKDMAGEIHFLTWQRNKYIKTGLEYGSRLFEVFMSIWNIKREEFCYSGDWKIHVDAETGLMRKCVCDRAPAINIFEDIDKPVKFEAVGNNCRSAFCWNGNAYLAAGVIPEVKIPLYGEIRDVKNEQGVSWITPQMRDFLSQRLDESNRQYSYLHKMLINMKYKLRGW